MATKERIELLQGTLLAAIMFGTCFFVNSGSVGSATRACAGVAGKGANLISIAFLLRLRS